MATLEELQAERARRTQAAPSSGPTLADIQAERTRRQAPAISAGVDPDRMAEFTPEQQAFINDVHGQPEYSETDAAGAPGPLERAAGAVADTTGAFAAGVGRGAMELAGLPGTIGSLLDAGYEKAGLIPEGSREELGAMLNPISGATIRGVASQATGGATEFRSETGPGRIAGTVGEFMGGGAGARVGTVAGISSELAGMATEGTAAEPYARIGAGIAGALVAGPKGAAFAGDDEAARMANLLESNGVRGITSGQARGSQPLMRAEGRLQPSATQIEDFTAATMRQLGSSERIATPSNLRAIEQSIVSQMDEAVEGLSVLPSASQAQDALKIGADYVDRVPAGSLTPRVRGIAGELHRLANTHGPVRPVPLSRLKEWRSDIGRLTTSPDAATRDAAHGLRSIIDDMTDDALTAAGRTADISKLSAARESYRNYIAVRDAASRAGAEGGVLSPQALNQSMIRAQGREAYATGRTTDMAEFTRAGASVLRPAPAVNAGGARTISDTVPLAGGALFAGGALQAGADPLTAAVLGIGGALAPSLGQNVMRSNPVQTALRNPNVLASAPVRSAGGLASGGQR